MINPRRIYFAFGESDGGWFVLVKEELWNSEKLICDQSDEELIEYLKPLGFSEVCEGYYNYNGNIQDGRISLLEAGFVHDFELQKFCDI